MWIAGEIKSSISIYGVAYNIVEDILDYDKFIPNKIDIFKNLRFDVLEEIKKILVFDKCAVVKIMSK